ncbi:Malonyl-CoA O-methyltransferase BioC [Cardinium endosymbiont of Sogatella furcifera]|uniref:methyltransferase domain-containing protein n=1 Tax=Cardinium endosymbiont of Sogatella furcifera TaxID=650378 RepID=UPI000E0DE8F6|nr:methyltransferase domain-containing protein [Cardinium endosymbiont of Sogatella furcifera]AXI24640.1 Malonyl-CoA O-methyltransferase BioC [Cardinium endosymbiont of Sogatella furcifera]
MVFQKAHIKSNFDRASSSYDSVASIQKKCAIELVNYLKKYAATFYPDSILDLGTGTGYIPKILSCYFPESQFTINDLSPNMLAQAKKKLENKKVEFILGDMEIQNFDFHDLVISNLALQWVNDHNKVIKKFYEHSRIFAFSSLLDGTFSEWSKIFIESSLPTPTHQYPSRQALEDYLLSLTPSKCFFNSQEFHLAFSNSSSFIKYLNNLGANYSNQQILVSDLKKIIKTYTDKINITYKVFFGILSK